MKNTFQLLTVAAVTTFTLCLTTIPQTMHISEAIPVITEALEDADMTDFAPNYGISPLSDKEDHDHKEDFEH